MLGFFIYIQGSKLVGWCNLLYSGIIYFRLILNIIFMVIGLFIEKFRKIFGFLLLSKNIEVFHINQEKKLAEKLIFYCKFCYPPKLVLFMTRMIFTW